jgi:hypothetical protein
MLNVSSNLINGEENPIRKYHRKGRGNPDPKEHASLFEVDYDGQTLTFHRNEAALAKEVLRDGKFLIKTNADLSSADVVTGYKTLIQVERTFKRIS